ncbi:MAG: tRNA preQ1(34) S-adenosylmethionine ribosyltransferase-isomerase QueA [Terriglobales bacterium]|jgi:S-adenosylmethionine:tRNA ribosyltransferase-isomerase
MLVSDFDYYLPQELIAREPLVQRSGSRMLHLQCGGNSPAVHFEDRWFHELPTLLRRDDLVVFNNTKVLPARLYGRRQGVHAQPVGKGNPAGHSFLSGRVEILLVRQVSEDPQEWEALVHPGRKIKVGERLFFEDNEFSLRRAEELRTPGASLEAEVTARGEYGLRRLRFAEVPDFFSMLERLGRVPLPPYLDRKDRPADRERYQTVYARERGSVAAPTAGLHFTPEILDSLRLRGIETAEITLHVGLGTFQPVHVERVEDHQMHREWYCIPEQAAVQINRALDGQRRIVAIGTTTVRTLEFVAATNTDGRIAAGAGEAELFIYPGYQFRVAGALLTNFHLPKSTLLMLVCAFAGKESALTAYQHAVSERYRFYSYGDCMLID